MLKPSCLWAQTTFLVRRWKSREETHRAQGLRTMQQAVYHLSQVYCPNVRLQRWTNTCMSQNRYVDTQGCAVTVPRRNHGTHAVLTTVEETSAAPTMGLTL